MSTPQTDPSGDSTLKTAGEIVALLAGVVAILYAVGGLVVSARLLSDGFPAEAVVDSLGQAPRELIISRGMIQAIAPAALVAIGAGAVYGVLQGPKKKSEADKDPVMKAGSPRKIVGKIGKIVGLAALLLVPGMLLAIWTDDFSTEEAFAAVVAFVVTIAVVTIGRRVLRWLGRVKGNHDRDGDAEHGRTKGWDPFMLAAAGGGVWALMALVPIIFAVGVVPFQPVQVCVEEAGGEAPSLLGEKPETSLTLVAQTRDRTIFAVEKSGDDGKAKSILGLPTSKITRLQFGELDPEGISCTDDP